MPFAVRQWPVAPDPRGPLYSREGWDWGQVVSWRWIASSVGAVGPWAFLNDGIVLTSNIDTPSQTEWIADPATPDDPAAFLTKDAFIPPIGDPEKSITLQLDLIAPPEVVHGIWSRDLLFPDAIREFGPFEITQAGVPVDDVPNGVKITPAKWDFEWP